MNIHRTIRSLGICGVPVLSLLVLITSSCRAPWTSPPASIDSELMVFGGKVGTLARTVQSSALFIQAELTKPQPNVHELQEAQVRIFRAHLAELPRAPKELFELHDLWIEASFECQYVSEWAVINLSGDLTSCLAKIEVVVKETMQYMPTQEAPTTSIP